MERIETIEVIRKASGDKIKINKSSFDPSLHLMATRGVVQKEEVEVVENEEVLEDLTVAELRELALAEGLKEPLPRKKDDLIEAIIENRNSEE